MSPRRSANGRCIAESFGRLGPNTGPLHRIGYDRPARNTRGGADCSLSSKFIIWRHAMVPPPVVKYEVRLPGTVLTTGVQNPPPWRWPKYGIAMDCTVPLPW